MSPFPMNPGDFKKAKDRLASWDPGKKLWDGREVIPRCEQPVDKPEDLIRYYLAGEVFQTDELLSMGQSCLVHSLGDDCDKSIFLSGPRLLSEEGAHIRSLALYDVVKNKLGFNVEWPGKD